ncbi:maleylpyruvate isomerase family mycothiol-dependent enzyme [Nocardioides dongkuii]|uniref:maleylpyruvate isomerase family mycothiol-dependent enzyme n=1 Tax=Nocardioides dongkuii TaxID=2760089 RepID=UPI001877F1EF|nr:maleylpyruvate isomerase family mycothiol-dependent enzyme [Nocardioides dongkuii]
MDVMLEAERDRGELAELLAGLDPLDWEMPSLCAGWTVRDVVAHVLSYEGLGMAEVGARMIRGRLIFDRMTAVGLAEAAGSTPEDLMERLGEYPRPTGLTAAMGGAVGLVDGLIHQQDIRRPLGKPRPIDPARLRFALKFAVTAPPLRGFWKVRGVRVIATDVDWSFGRGAEARGPGEAVLMAMAGRAAAAHDLNGPGSPKLQNRFG